MASTLKTAPNVRMRPRQSGGETTTDQARTAADDRVIAARRRSDRRRGIVAVCQALAASLMREEGEATRTRFLDGVRRVLPAAASVALRDWRAGETPVAAPNERRLLSVDVPTADPRIVAALDAVPLETRRFDEWDLQVLTLAGRMAGVLLEVEALRRTQRASAFRVFPGRPDGAAPLIGSTPVMRALRDRIERLAATDFTVLIEGPMQRQ